ncbi:unnamed protein product [Linum trigynum]|uniref:Uncharacterized protein n=1 Tax=Linum trigynum TaxID=586398 RepID=A0AAV2EFL2_9ROSI
MGGSAKINGEHSPRPSKAVNASPFPKTVPDADRATWRAVRRRIWEENHDPRLIASNGHGEWVSDADR